MAADRSHALDHVVLVLFENRSLDNLLGHLYGPEDGKTFEGVIGKGLSNPIPEWAEHGADRKTVPYTVGTDMDAPNPDSGEEYFHTNTQLFNVLDEHNRFKLAEEVTAPWNAPGPGAVPSMDGFVTDYISTFTSEMGRQPTYEEYAQIMTGYTPEQVPVLNTIAKGFGVFDHWFCEVPSQTLMNRSFWTAATSSGFVINKPASNFVQHNSAETLFERLEAHGRTWKVYVQEPMSFSAAALIHMSRLKDRLATNFVPFSEFEPDVANGTLPDFSMIEPNLIMGHSDYHPAVSRALGPGVEVPLDAPSSILGGEAFLARIYTAIRSAASPEGSNAYNTTFFIGWDEPGGTYDHVPPGPVPPPDPSAPAGQLDFMFDRSGYRVPAIVVSPWVDEGIVINDEYRHTSMIATLRKDLGDAFTARDGAARTFDHLLSRESPRDPASWPDVQPRPVPAFQMDEAVMSQALSTLGHAMGGGMVEKAKQAGITVPPELTDPASPPSAASSGALRGSSSRALPRPNKRSSAPGATASYLGIRASRLCSASRPLATSSNSSDD